MCLLYKNKNLSGGGGNPLLGKTKETHAMGLIPLILAVVIGATVITPMVGWMLSLNASISNIDGKLEAMSVATTEWNRLNSMSMEDLESQASALSDYKVGDYQVLVNIGDKGHMADGSCKTSGLGADDKLNCYKDSKITIRKDNQTLYTSRLMPLSVNGQDENSGGNYEFVTLDYSRQREGSLYAHCNSNTQESVQFNEAGLFYPTYEEKSWDRDSDDGMTTYFTINGNNPTTLNGAIVVKKGDIIQIRISWCRHAYVDYHYNFIPFKKITKSGNSQLLVSEIQ